MTKMMMMMIIIKDKKGSACSMHIEFWCDSQKERDQWENLDVGERIIFKLSVEKLAWAVWSELIWLRIGTSEELL
jgi:hypothetical protein